MAVPIIDHNLLTLDYWQDSVTYEGKTVPSGTIGCEALNIPDTLREKLAQTSIPLQKIVAAIKENDLTIELLRPAKGSVLHMIQLAKDTLPFSRADAAYYNTVTLKQTDMRKKNKKIAAAVYQYQADNDAVNNIFRSCYNLTEIINVVINPRGVRSGFYRRTE